MVAAWGDPQSRTQEARVILGAREMLEGPAERWLIPTANGETRLRKPPFGYWASAVSMAVLGEGVLAARVPAVLASWGTIALTFLIGRRLFGERAGLYAAGMLLGSWLFFRHGVLAETDVLVMALMAAAVYAILRARDVASGRPWLHLAAIATACIALTKGPPAGCVALFLVGVDLVDRNFTRNWRHSIAWRFVSSGAIVTLLLLGLPWFAFAALNAEGHQLTDDFRNSIRGGLGHSEPWWDYFPQMLLAILPWTFVWVVAGLASLKLLLFRKDMSEERASMLILYAWGMAVFAPLMAWGNKQPHYLLSMIPAMMLTAGWAVDRGLSYAWPSLRPAVAAILNVMMWVLLIAPPAIVLAIANNARPNLQPIDWAIPFAMLAIAGGLMLACWKWKRLTLAPSLIAGVASAFVLVMSVWAPTLESQGYASMARQLRERFPEGRFVFRRDVSLTLCVAMRQIVPVVDDLELQRLAAVPSERMRIVCLYESEMDLPPLPNYREVMRLEGGENDITVLTPTPLVEPVSMDGAKPR